MKYKLIVSDLDDTLLTDEGICPVEVKNSVTKYIDKGGKFVVCTGRMTLAVLPYCHELGLHGELMSFQGAITSDIDTGVILDSQRIDYTYASEVATYLEKRGLYFQSYYTDYFITETATKYTKIYADVTKSRFEEVKVPLSQYFLEKKLSPPKIICIAESSDVPNLINELSEKFGDKLLVNTSKPWLVELVPKSINKGIAVEKLAKKYNIKKEEVICVGDSANDISMIEYAGIGAVVENGSKEAKQVADIIIPSNNDFGVSFLIEKYGFLE